MHEKIKVLILFLALFLFSLFFPHSSINAQEIDLIVRQQLEAINQELQNQKSANSALAKQVTDLADQQSDIFDEVKNTNATLANLTLNSNSITDQFKDAFALDKKGVPFAFIDTNLNIYDYNSGNLLGWIDEKTKQVIRNFDQSAIALYDNDFFIDETGHPIASIERSEHLRWDREKMYSKTQKTPVSHFFIMNLPQQVFIPTNFRFNSWAEKHISEILYFDPEKVQSQN